MTVKARFALTAVVVAAIAIPLIWQENAIAKIRAENRDLAAGVASLDELRAEHSQLAAQPNGDAETEHAARERTELERLRTDASSLREQVQQTRVERQAAASTVAAVIEKNRPALKPGFVSVGSAREVGAATGEALFQSFAAAIRTGNTNRLVELLDWSAEGAAAQVDGMLKHFSKMSTQGEMTMNGSGFKVLRQVPIESGDSALVMDTQEGAGETKRVAFRIRRAGTDWRIVLGRSGPEEVKLSDAFMGD